ncbi:hypothetical protein ABK040_001213 [Willaertia magna]
MLLMTLLLSISLLILVLVAYFFYPTSLSRTVSKLFKGDPKNFECKTNLNKNNNHNVTSVKKSRNKEKISKPNGFLKSDITLFNKIDNNNADLKENTIKNNVDTPTNIGNHDNSLLILENKKLQQQCQDLQEKKNSLKEKIKIKKEIIETLKNDNNETKLLLQQLQNKELDKDDYNNLLENYKLKNYENKLLESELKNKKKILMLLKNKIKNLQNDFVIERENYQILKEEKDEIINYLNKQINQQNKTLQISSNTILEITKEKENILNKNEQLQKEINNLQKNINIVTNEKITIVNNFNQFKEQTNNEIQKLKQKNIKLQQDLNSVTNEKTNIENSLNQFKIQKTIEIQKLKEENLELKNQLQQEKAKYNILIKLPKTKLEPVKEEDDKEEEEVIDGKELINYFRKNWKDTQRDFCKKYGINEGHFSSHINLKEDSPASRKALQQYYRETLYKK